ncbi:hypothetical protein GCM10027036_16720 [Flavihumibacter cheonanensis]|uniref:DUF4230 domain-containing protein n=1 Tax=Flavihumibacter cheonanensis TaxID=1442385 RepID=UPI001EF7A651|nr:DUF4230 domain-containing protein [Flavihumibacter cheonanensis]MCG7750887.1 DUF4230 domain-containing protein [Flavihumibacter cheonanensis]
MRGIVKIVAALVIVVLLYSLLVKLNWLPSVSSWFKASTVLIEETPLLITEIKQIATLLTIESSDEVVVSQVRPVPSGSPKKILDYISPVPLVQAERLVLVVKGKVIAGTDLSRLESNAVFISDDSVSVTIPAARIQDIIVNPSGTDIFIEDGNWSQAETNKLVSQASEKLRQRATEKGILEKADEQALKVLRNFLELQGFQKIRVATN